MEPSTAKPEPEQWIAVDNGDGTETNYYVDAVFSLNYNNRSIDYFVLVLEQDYPDLRSEDVDVFPSVMRYDSEADSLSEIEDEDEKAFVVHEIAEAYEREALRDQESEDDEES